MSKIRLWSYSGDHPTFYFPPALCFSCDFSVLAAGVRNAFCSFHSRKCARQFGSWKFWKIPPQKTNCLDLWKCCYWWQFWFWEYVVSPSLSCSHDRTIKVEKILKASLDLIPSPSPSVKIQIMDRKVCLRCKGKIQAIFLNRFYFTIPDP